MNELFFNVPPDSSVLRDLIIGGIPDSWRWLDGELAIPRRKIHPTNRLESAGLIATSRTFGRHMVIRDNNISRAARYTVKEVLTLLTTSKLPRYVRFEEAAHMDGESLAPMKTFASLLVEIGYGGSLRFYRDSPGGLDENAPWCFLFLQSDGWWLMSLGWSEGVGAEASDIAPVLQVARSHHLEEFIPRSI